MCCLPMNVTVITNSDNLANPKHGIWRQDKVYYDMPTKSFVTETLFIVQTDAHYYKVIEMLKQFSNLKL